MPTIDLRNQLARTLAYLAVETYESTWQTFFRDFLTLARQPAPQTEQPFTRHVIIMLVLAILDEFNAEVGDPILRGARTFEKSRLTRDSRLRDQIRTADAANIIECLLTMVEKVYVSIENPQSPWTSKAAEETASTAMSVFAAFARES